MNAVIFPILADNENGAKQLEASCDDCQIPIFFDEKKTVIAPLRQEVSLLKLGRMPAVIIADMNGT
nr:hypothetical protein [Candidatus Sigynarchaeota archaeon]